MQYENENRRFKNKHGVLKKENFEAPQKRIAASNNFIFSRPWFLFEAMSDEEAERIAQGNTRYAGGMDAFRHG